MEKTDKSDNMFKSGYAPYRSIGVSEEGELAYFWLSPEKRAYLSRGRHHPQLFGGLQPPEGEISSSVFYFFSECLIYSGAIFGVKLYIKHELQKQYQKG